FLIHLSRQTPYLSTITVLNQKGIVIASSYPRVIGSNQQKLPAFQTSVAGKPYWQDVYRAPNGARLVAFAFPIRAGYDEQVTIGVLLAQWDAGRLFEAIQRKHGRSADAL